MNQTDVYYRALLDYRKEVSENRACLRDTRLYAEASGHGSITVKRALCTVDEAWIREIEKGLEYIGNAIRENREHITANGEVVDIAKVKSVSKESVSHLARHSELIKRKPPEGGDIIPDSLYTVERLSDHAIYENRFLYMLLCYLRDFVTQRYRNILELTNRYEGVLSVEREIKSLNRQIHLTIEMNEVRRDDPYLREHNTARDLIDRMDLILKNIVAFLATPLMESAGKGAMLKPPITKTNILKMDNNFKGAMDLYEYIIAYEGDGYTVENQELLLNPFRDDLAEDMAETERLMSFLTYQYGMQITPELSANYDREEARRREEELKQKTEQMSAVYRRMKAEGKKPENYILDLEKHMRTLQNQVDSIPGLTDDLKQHEANERHLNTIIGALNEKVAMLENELRQTTLEHEANVRATAETHAADLAHQNALHEVAMDDLRIEHKTAVAMMTEAHDNEIARWRTSLAATEEALAGARREKDAVTEEKRLINAQLRGLRATKGSISAEETLALTREEDFNELEHELEAFVRFYETQWTLTKRAIRKDLLNLKSIKGQNGRK